MTKQMLFRKKVNYQRLLEIHERTGRRIDANKNSNLALAHIYKVIYANECRELLELETEIKQHTKKDRIASSKAYTA